MITRLFWHRNEEGHVDVDEGDWIMGIWYSEWYLV